MSTSGQFTKTNISPGGNWGSKGKGTGKQLHPAPSSAAHIVVVASSAAALAVVTTIISVTLFVYLFIYLLFITMYSIITSNA